jgi:hypothetical protein
MEQTHFLMMDVLPERSDQIGSPANLRKLRLTLKTFCSES